jgi:hypothetical protein
MSLPFGNIDTAFEHFLQELPEDYWDLAIELGAALLKRRPVAQNPGG